MAAPSLYHELFYLEDGTTKNSEEWDNLGALLDTGFTDEQVAVYYGIARNSIGEWKRKYPEFFRFLKEHKKIADDGVERALYERAMGFEHIETKVFVDKGSVTYVDVVKVYPPDTQAARYWLNNRQPDRWKEVVQNNNVNQTVEPVAFDLSALTDEESDKMLEFMRKMDKAKQAGGNQMQQP
jgi:hypothetical protein